MTISLPIVSKFDPTGVRKAQDALGGFGKKLAGIGAAVAGAFAVRAIFNFGKEAILAAEAVETANNRLRAIAKATQVFGAETDKVTKSLIKFAESQEMVIAVDAEVIKGVQAQLLSFKKLSASAGQVGGVFERVTKAAFDMAAAGFGSAESNAIALGKAFEDPIRGLTALRRSGTVFTEEQQKLIKTLVDSGDLLGAQTIILEELETQYGGTAEATANWSDKLNLAFDNVKESVGKSLTPAFEQFAKFLIERIIPPVTKFFDEDFPVMLQKFGAMGAGLSESLAPIGQALREAFDIPEDVSLLESLMDSIAALPDNPIFMELVDSFVKLTPELLKLLPPLTQLTLSLLPIIIQITPFLTHLVTLLAGAFDDAAVEADTLADSTVNIREKFNEFIIKRTEYLPVLGLYVKAFVAIQDAIAGAIKKLEAFFRTLSGGPAGIRFEIKSGGAGRAVGGPVSANRSYTVGERGPELFTPGVGGFITPNNRLGGSSGNTYNITVNSGLGSNGAQIGQEIVSLIKKYERVSGPVFASA